MKAALRARQGYNSSMRNGEKQGDSVGIVDAVGNPVVEYRYDAWGKSISTAGSKADTLGKLNPFRYCGVIMQ